MDLDKLEKVVNELEVNSNQLIDFTGVYSKLGKLQLNINQSLKHIEQNNGSLNKINETVKGSLIENTELLENIHVLIENKIGEIYKDNKSFQKELDATLITRLDKHKSDIQIEVRNEGVQIQRAFETALQSNFNDMESKLKKDFESQEAKLNELKIMLFLIIAICTGLAFGLIMK